MTQHLANRLDRYAIGQRDCRGKRMTRCMECHFLGDLTSVCDFLQVVVHLLIRKRRKYFPFVGALRVVGVSFYDFKCLRQ